MSQDNPNDQVDLEEPQVVAMISDDRNQPSELAQPSQSTEISDGTFATESQIGEDAKEDTPSLVTDPNLSDEEDDEISEDESSVEENAADETSVSAPATNPANAQTPQSSSIAPVVNEDADADERCELQKQPYAFDHCTIQIAIQLLPNDGDPNGRQVVVGVRSHLDAPILRLVRWHEIGALPPLVDELLNALKAELPAREQAARDIFEKKKSEKAQRKAVVTASKTMTRGKKNKTPTQATSPTANVTATDNRPRPKVQVSVTPQQQIGLF
ncbi:hypothetical protein ANRL1_00402 [Anaerolineae bacterium]|nr:hypothetical protein ANRL1_00402 [Anaerolineae bacterium]